MRQREQNESKTARELAKRKKQQNMKPLKYGLFLALAALFLAGVVDEITSCINTQVQSSVVTEFFVRPMNLPFNEAMSKFSTVKLISYALMILVPFYKALSDKFGRKPFLIFNTMGMGFGLFLAFWSPNVTVYFIGYGLMSFFVMHDMQIVYLYEIVPKEKRATIYGLIKGIGTLSVILIPLLRGAVMGNDTMLWRGVYLIPAILAIGISIFSLLITRESKTFLDQRIKYLELPYEQRNPSKKENTSNNQQKSGIFQAMKYLFKNKQLLWLSIISIVFTVCSTTMAAFPESIMTDYGMSTQSVTQALLIYPFLYAALLSLAGIIGDKFGRKTIVCIAGICSIVGFVCFNLSAFAGITPYAVGIFYGVYLGCWWLTVDYISMMVAESAPTYNRSSVLGAVGLISMIGSILGQVVPIGAALIFEKIGFGYMTVVIPFVVIGVILVIWKAKETKGVDLNDVV